MKTFQEWMAERHPEMFDEGILQNMANSRRVRNLVAGAALTAGSLGFGARAASAAAPKAPVKAAQQEDDDDDQDVDSMDVRTAIARQERDARALLAAAKRAGVPEREWNRLRTDGSAGGVITRVNGRDVPLTPREREIVQDALRQKAEFDAMNAGAGGAGRAAAASRVAPSGSAVKKAVESPPRKFDPARAKLPRLPSGVGQSPNWNPD